MISAEGIFFKYDVNDYRISKVKPDNTTHYLLEGEHLEPSPDLVIVGNTVSKDNPQVVNMCERNLPCCSMPKPFNIFLEIAIFCL
jgi:UDP-N-acetylmuramate-alanine ligase